MNNYNYLQKQASIILNLFNSKNYDEVITRCKTLIKKYPEQVMFYNVAALSYASLKNNLEGLNILNQALKMHRDNLLILNNIGLLNSNLNNNKVARQYYDKALSINENFIDALVNKAHLELKENKTNETERLFLKAHGVNKTIQQQEVIETGLAQLYQQIGNFKKSIKIFQDILKYNPSNTLAHKSISVMHTYKDKNDEHLKKMEEQLKLIKNKDHLPPLYFAIGKAYEDLNDYQKSFHFIKSANDGNPAGYYFYDLNAKLNHKFSENDRLYLSAYLGKDKFYLTESDNDDFLDDDLNYESTSENDFGLDWGNITSSLRWNHLFSNKLFANTTLTYSKYQFNTLFDSRSSNSMPYEFTADTTHFKYFVLPKLDGGVNVILDVGANADCKPDVLYQFGILGSLFAEHVCGVESPRVGLLNIGEEETKGNMLTIAAHEMMKDTTDFNFCGNIESRHLFDDECDVIVCDGFSGNVILKQAESVYSLIKKRKICFVRVGSC